MGPEAASPPGSAETVFARTAEELERSAAVLSERAADAADPSLRALGESVADVCRTTARMRQVIGEWPELVLVQARAAYEATRIAAGECAKDERWGACVPPLSDTRDSLKQLLGALESASATTPVGQRDLPREDADDDGAWAASTAGPPDEDG